MEAQISFLGTMTNGTIKNDINKDSTLIINAKQKLAELLKEFTCPNGHIDKKTRIKLVYDVHSESFKFSQIDTCCPPSSDGIAQRVSKL